MRKNYKHEDLSRHFVVSTLTTASPQFAFIIATCQAEQTKETGLSTPRTGMIIISRDVPDSTRRHIADVLRDKRHGWMCQHELRR